MNELYTRTDTYNPEEHKHHGWLYVLVLVIVVVLVFVYVTSVRNSNKIVVPDNEQQRMVNDLRDSRKDALQISEEDKAGYVQQLKDSREDNTSSTISDAEKQVIVNQLMQNR